MTLSVPQRVLDLRGKLQQCGKQLAIYSDSDGGRLQPWGDSPVAELSQRSRVVTTHVKSVWVTPCKTYVKGKYIEVFLAHDGTLVHMDGPSSARFLELDESNTRTVARLVLSYFKLLLEECGIKPEW